MVPGVLCCTHNGKGADWEKEKQIISFVKITKIMKKEMTDRSFCFSKGRKQASNSHPDTRRQDWSKAPSLLCTKPAKINSMKRQMALRSFGGRNTDESCNKGFLFIIAWTEALKKFKDKRTRLNQAWSQIPIASQVHSPLHCVKHGSPWRVGVQNTARIRTVLAVFEFGLTGAVLLFLCHSRIRSEVKQSTQRNTETDVGERKSRRCTRKQRLDFPEVNAEMSSGAVTLSSPWSSERQIKGLLVLSLVRLILFFHEIPLLQLRNKIIFAHLQKCF